MRRQRGGEKGERERERIKNLLAGMQTNGIFSLFAQNTDGRPADTTSAKLASADRPLQ